MKVGARRASMDIGVQIVARIANLVLGVVVTLVIIHTLGKAGFGDWSTIFAVVQIALNFGEVGIGQVAVSRAAGAPAEESDWLSGLLSLRLAFSLPITVLSIVSVLLIAPSAASRVAGVLISCSLLLGAPSAMSATFQLRVRNDISMAILTLNSVMWTLAVVVAAALGAGIVTIAAAFLAVSIVTSTLTLTLAHRMLPVRLHGTRAFWRPLLRVGLGVGAAGILVTSYARLDQILVLEFAGADQAGLYGAAYRVLDQVQFIPASVMTTLFPLIAASFPGDLGRVRELLQLTAEYLTIASLPILAFTIVAAGPTARLLFGVQFTGAADALPILMAAFVAISFGYLTASMIVVLELQRAFLRSAAIGLLVNAGLNLIFIPPYGFRAAAWITLVTEATVMALMMRQIIVKLPLRLRLGRLTRTLSAAIAMGVLTWLARELGAPLAALVAVAGASYVCAVLGLRVVSPSEIRALLRREGPLADARGA